MTDQSISSLFSTSSILNHLIRNQILYNIFYCEIILFKIFERLYVSNTLSLGPLRVILDKGWNERRYVSNMLFTLSLGPLRVILDIGSNERLYVSNSLSLGPLRVILDKGWIKTICLHMLFTLYLGPQKGVTLDLGLNE